MTTIPNILGADVVSEITKNYEMYNKSSDLYIFSNLPRKKLMNATNGYARGVDPSEVIYLLNATVFGSGKEGIILTPTRLYIKVMGETAMYYDFNIISDIRARENSLSSSLEISYTDGTGNFGYKSYDIVGAIKGYEVALVETVKLLMPKKQEAETENESKTDGVATSTSNHPRVCNGCGATAPRGAAQCEYCDSYL